jgi:flagellar hook assembly protein FlgD
MSWRFDVSWGRAQGEVEVSWPDLSRVPHDYGLTLQDLDSGSRVSMRHRASYTLDASSPAGIRHLQVTATQGRSAGVRIAAMVAEPTAAGAQIVFTLSAAATCDAEVLNIAGRTIRRLTTGDVLPAGRGVVLWDGRADTGTKVPPGAYLVRLTARSEDGTRTSALRNLRIRR